MGGPATDGILERPEELGRGAEDGFSVLLVSSLLSDGKMEDVDILAGLADWGWASSLGSSSLSAGARSVLVRARLLAHADAATELMAERRVCGGDPVCISRTWRCYCLSCALGLRVRHKDGPPRCSSPFLHALPHYTLRNSHCISP